MQSSPTDRRIERIVFSNPPVNALDHATRRYILDRLRSALADEGVAGVVLIGEGARFSGGADVREFNTPAALAAPSIVDIGDAIDASTKPVAAAIEGIALGGGLELALFCHFRVAARDARVGLPEATLGVLPGARGTQRLPRLIGGPEAIAWMTKGQVVDAEKAQAAGLLDEVVSSDVAAAGEALVMRHLASGKPLPALMDRPVEVPGDPKTFFASAREEARRMGRGPAPEAIVGCVEAAATLPVDEAGEVEAKAFARLAETPESLALRHLFFAERAASRIDGLDPSVKPRKIAKVGVLGAGTMGTGIAMAFANAGFQTRLTDTSAEAMQRSRDTRSRAYASAVKRGRMSEAKAESAVALIVESTSMDELSDCDLVVEAVVEKLDVKKEVLSRLAGLLGPDAIIATNTSYLDIDVLAATTGRSKDVLGLHFFSPAHVMKLVEVVRGRDTSDEVLVTAMNLVKRIGKIGIVAGVCDGFIGNRMVDQYFLSANELLMEGATPKQVDDAIRGYGFAMGPFTMSDMAGNDIGWFSRKRRREADPDYSYPVIADAIAERGWFGQKSGRGYFLYAEGSREPKESPDVEALLMELRAKAGIEPRRFEDAEIVERCIYALVNEGARLLDEGIAQRASDIDVAYVRGYGFPDLKGGPMHQAEAIGLGRVLERIKDFHAASGDERWEPARLLVAGASAAPSGWLQGQQAR